MLGASLIGKEVTIFTNSPSPGQPFQRNSYRQLSWCKEDSCTFSGIVDSSNLFVDLKLELPGSVHFYTTVEDEVVGSGYFVVEPILSRGSDRMYDIQLNAIQCQTVLSKCLGSLDEWSQRLLVAQRSGYNMIHFTPIQELGASNSAYSLKNHFAVNPTFSYIDKKVDFPDIEKFVEVMRNDWKVLSITDIVLNHTANETPWIQEHPEVGFNLVNSPHLRPAFLLDRLLAQVTLDIETNKCRTLTNITSEEDLQLLREVIVKDYLPKVRLEEFFLFNVDDALQVFNQVLKSDTNHDITDKSEGLVVIQDPLYRRLSNKVSLSSVISFFGKLDRNIPTWKEDAIKKFNILLEETKQRLCNQVQDHLNNAVENVIRAARYERLEAKEKTVVNRASPIITPYFLCSEEDFTVIETAMDDKSKAAHFLAHNGWVMNFDPLKNFAAPDCQVYLRRELIAWCDSVKLNYGDKPEDNPVLWTTMKKYVEQTAQIFDGIRLDNCHSTPIHVATYMLDAARAIRPNLYVIAELFTSSEETDNIFVNRLGINSLIRESMACKDSHDLGRLIHRFGGEPVGAFGQSQFRPLLPTFPHAIFFDATHDNESPIIKRSPYDLLPTAALIAMSECATGSNRGYDELVPQHIHVVNENRLYTLWNKNDDENENVVSENDGNADTSVVDFHTGIIRAKQILNNMHLSQCQGGYREIFVDQVDSNVVAITRHNPRTHKSIVLVARTCFTKQDPAVTGFIRNIDVPGEINSIIFEARMSGKPSVFEKNEKYINGLPDFGAEVRQNVAPDKSNLITVMPGQGVTVVKFDKFSPGSVVCFDVSPNKHHSQAMSELKELLKDIQANSKLGIQSLDLLALNHVMFKSDQEEKDDDAKSGVYNIPGFGDLTYAGFCGLMFHWRQIRSSNDLGHPICNNLRAGNWLPSYISSRLLRKESTKALGEWLGQAFEKLDQIPRNLIPCYFDAIITPVYTLLLQRLFELQSKFVSQGSHLIQRLALGTQAVIGFNPTSPLPLLSVNVSNKPPEIVMNGIKYQLSPTIAAGLPHFASGYVRNWGRDTFIAIRGTLMIPGRFVEAQRIILGFGGCIRHGLIPNLLDKGTNARFNCRDATWFWLQSIKDYCNLAPNGEEILKEPVRRLFPTDDAEGDFDKTVDQPLHQVLQEILIRHFRGIDFMERNWGHKIDAHMTEAGFRVTVGVDRETGFIFGGNKWNCGTWMDKMGSSSKAGNRGIPSTPRDGAAVEIVGLSYSVLTWLVDMQAKGVYPYECVADDTCKWTWKDWSERIKINFDKWFFVSPETRDPLANKRNIYKDTVGATEEWQDFQLRPNFAVAMSVAPDLFPVDHARAALNTFKNVLLGPLGVKTLDPSDWNYRGDYDNSNDSSDPKVAQGFNYHQGPVS